MWRRTGERYADGCVREEDPWRGASLVVWGGIGLNQHVGPVFFQNIDPECGNSAGLYAASAGPTCTPLPDPP